ncbi:hypothetical protein TIFTF001_031530 [Ficus carica]|uniref:DUF1985 domain-containing protein n=1 Tax=Ficus carica TaxID=3494 RepID=A0AA88J5M1_FICCA|nr:hypothetical protein TIFTF001_031530 [Ficus carica]
MRRYFSTLRAVSREHLEVQLSNAKFDNDDNVVKLGLLYMIFCIPLANVNSVKIDPKYFALADNLEELNAFPWGVLSWEATRAAYERIPTIAGKFMTKHVETNPRMLSWTSMNNVKFDALMSVLTAVDDGFLDSDIGVVADKGVKAAMDFLNTDKEDKDEEKEDDEEEEENEDDERENENVILKYSKLGIPYMQMIISIMTHEEDEEKSIAEDEDDKGENDEKPEHGQPDPVCTARQIQQEKWTGIGIVVVPCLAINQERRTTIGLDWPLPTTPRLCTMVSNLPAILDARLWKVGTATVKLSTEVAALRSIGRGHDKREEGEAKENEEEKYENNKGKEEEKKPKAAKEKEEGKEDEEVNGEEEERKNEEAAK